MRTLEGDLVTMRGLEPHAHTRAMAETIRAEMAIARVTKKAMAEATGIGLRTLDRYVAGERDVPYSSLVGIAEAMYLTVSELVTQAEERAARGARS